MREEEALRLVGELELKPHPEGGFFGETFRSTISVSAPQGLRSAITSIYYLLSATNFAAFHRIKSDEIWHHYRGAPVAIDVIEADGRYRQMVIGDGNHWQAALLAGSWFASHVTDASAYALVGCDVGPGFAYEDFELAAREALTASFPQHRTLIERWTRE